MKVIGYFVSIISASIKDANILDKKIFVNNISYLFILSLVNFNLNFNQFSSVLNMKKCSIYHCKLFCQNVISVCLAFIYNRGTFPR